jgi:hypothetical protein
MPFLFTLPSVSAVVRSPIRVLFATAFICPLLGATVQEVLEGSVPGDVEVVEVGAPANRIMATVSGEPITSSDVNYSLWVLAQGGAADPELEATILRRMAEEILLAQEATRLGLDLSPSQVDDRWQSWFGFKPNYEESALTSGTTVARQRALAKRTVLAELYVYNRVGLMNMPGARIEVDLALKHMVDVTPQQLREYFLEFEDQLGQPASVSFSAYPTADLETAESVGAALRRNLAPAGIQPIRQQIPIDAVSDVFAYEPELASFVREGLDGSISAPTLVQSEGGPAFLVVQITGHTEALPAVFGDVQDVLRNRIQSNLLVQAKREILLKLSRQAVYYPANLFSEPIPALPEEG